MTSGVPSGRFSEGWKYSIWSGWPAFLNNVLIRLARLKGEFHFGFAKTSVPIEISLVLSKQVSYHCQAMTNASSLFFFFNWLEDFKS